MPALGLLFPSQSLTLWCKPKFQTHAVWWVSQVLVQAEMLLCSQCDWYKTQGNCNFIGRS